VEVAVPFVPRPCTRMSPDCHREIGVRFDTHGVNTLQQLAPMTREVAPITDVASAVAFLATSRSMDSAKATGEALVALLDQNVGQNLNASA
jgi:hypothetical protein